MRRKPTRATTATRTPPSPSMKSPAAKSPILNVTTIAILAGVFIIGIGLGIAFSTTTTLDTRNVASREFIDRSAPNAELCAQYGASAMAMDTRLFVSLNPFNVYVSRPNLRPGCVMRTSNWEILKQRRLITSEMERDCKNRLNTFAYTGDLGNSPEISCVYQNDAAKNYYLTQPGAVAPPQETDRF